MNRILLTLKRPFIWLYRFRHRCGYGVHSPFAFNLITHVIYESTAYYKYEELAKAQKQLELEKDKRWKYESKKVKRLLFRLVNYTQPETIVDAGTLAASALYLKAGKEGADYTSASDLSELFLESGVPVDFLYLHDYRHPDFVEEVFHILFPDFLILTDIVRPLFQRLTHIGGHRLPSILVKIDKACLSHHFFLIRRLR